VKVGARLARRLVDRAPPRQVSTKEVKTTLLILGVLPPAKGRHRFGGQ
jgi:hypothetical protein